MLVDFMIIGAQKCATTTLFHILDSHPSIIGSRPKETNFFSMSPKWKDEIDLYLSMFEQKSGQNPLYFEASPTYTYYPRRNLNIWDDIFDYNPRMKFIYLVRNPIDRIVSSYMHSYERGYIDEDIDTAIRSDREFIDVTRYYTQISPYVKKFGSDSVHIITFEEFVRSKQQTLQRVSDFLGIEFSKFADYEGLHTNISVGGQKKHHKFDRISIPSRLVRKFLPSVWDKVTDNSGRGFDEKPVLNSETRKMILNLLEIEIRALQDLIRKDLTDWLKLE